MMQLHRNLAMPGALWDARPSAARGAMRDPFFGPFDPLQAAFATGQELYKAGLLATVNARRLARGRAPIGWPEVAPTPRELVHREGAARLYRYQAQGATASKPSILLVCSLINRPYVLDLMEGRSVVARLLEGGLDVWLLDWGTPGPDDAARGLADYALGVLPRAAEVARAAAGVDALHVLGYCMGGTFALAAVAEGALPAASLVALATPVDMHDSGQLSAWCRAPGFDPDELARAHGNVPPWILQPAFKMLDPVGLATKLAHLEPKIEDDDFLRFFLAMETWLEDSVAFPGQAFAEWVRAYRDNALTRGARWGGRAIDLGRVRCPLLTIVAEADYICPPQSSLALRAVAGTDDHELIIQPGGHIGLSTGTSAQARLWPRVAAWVKARDGAHPAAAPQKARAHKKSAARR
jgi:polyhydroxyalkanoate synthase